jgi:hypothetical protein
MAEIPWLESATFLAPTRQATAWQIAVNPRHAERNAIWARVAQSPQVGTVTWPIADIFRGHRPAWRSALWEWEPTELAGRSSTRGNASHPSTIWAHVNDRVLAGLWRAAEHREAALDAVELIGAGISSETLLSRTGS